MSLSGTADDRYTVAYDEPGTSDRSAMPLGNGRVGLSLWAQRDSGLQFYISHADALTELDRNVKLGKVFLAFDPDPFADMLEFSQTLHLREGRAVVRVRNPRGSVRIEVFVDAAADRVYATVLSDTPLRAEARVHSWRTAPKAPWSVPDCSGAPGSLIMESADHVEELDKGILFYHRNGKTCIESTARIEALGEHTHAIPDTLKGRTFGAYLTLAPQGAAKSHTLAISVFCEQAPELDKLIPRVLDAHKIASVPEAIASASRRTAAYWDGYFTQSYITVSGDREIAAPVPDDIAAVGLEPSEVSCGGLSPVTRSYLLTKYMFACASGGRMPMNFNGLIFNLMPGADRHLRFDSFCKTFAAQPKGEPNLEINPDEKGWESCIQLWQNLRLLYAPLLARGEYGALRRLFDYYRAFWDINRIRARVYYQAEGQYNTEMTHSFGILPLSVYGADRTNLKDGYAQNRWGGAVDISPGLELACMMLDYYDHTRDIDFLRDEAVPYAQDLLHFVETRFPERIGGKLRLTDLQSVETYFDTLNPITAVAGLWAVVDRLLALPKELVPGRAFFQSYRDRIPPLPMAKDMFGKDVLAPAEEHSPRRMNVENPELYSVYPFRLFTRYAASDPVRLELIEDTYRHCLAVSGCFQSHRFEYPPGKPCYSGWQYIGMVAALLGKADDAAKILADNCALKNPGTRFPAMWGPVYDGVPDGDHGGNITNILQLMVLQTEGDAIYLLPAWPVQWDVEFKLCAGNRTTVEGVYRSGRLVSLDVDPAERRKDVVLPSFIPSLPEQGA